MKNLRIKPSERKMFRLKTSVKFYLIGVLFGCLAWGNPMFAEAQGGISMQPVLPSNQKSETKGYFDLIMEKNQMQTIFISIQNQSDETKTLQILPSNALTNQNGGIHYTVGEGSSSSYSTDTDYFMKQYVEVQQTVTLPPRSQKKIPIRIHAPQKEGTYLGSILFSEDGKEKPKEQIKTFSITQESLFGIALQLTVEKEKKGEIYYKKTDIKFLPSGVYLYVTFENRFPQVLQDAKGSYVVKKSGVPVLKGMIDSFKMAPMSGVQYAIPWNADEIEKGDYQLELTISSNGKTQYIQENITAKESDIKVYENKNKPKSNLPQIKEKTSKNNQHMWWWIGGGVLLFLFGWLVGRKKKKEKDSGE